ncbi:MAG: ESX secretion-associated protein EspG [Mycobacterium sp.]|uniref:ESX secretion-associated protein EspG n=1 Tax=Mycobacterium sp. TaxID=1785 RepID=UPI000CC4C0EB|nr:ESX secretion-associated protein EspG [Mycobacterium sp.]PJE02614.1 MAG: ESX secretion-associated protein EspG [Mycobacterium sp.]PJE10722.1 MAG: ESX secretion-associated protein EspG [Mycobacterium sp.]PJE25357.1 MAG: ESX secretion-associated protein EspG [Mycobacterium sp.]
MTATKHPAIEVTAQQAWFLADHLRAGTYPWMLAITTPYVDAGERAPFNQRCRDELTESGVLDHRGQLNPSVAEAIRTACHPRQWLEWLTILGPDQILRGVLARTEPVQAVAVLRYAQMVTFTPLQLTDSEAIVPIVTAGLPPDQRAARFEEFSLSMDLGKAIDARIGRGADVFETLTDLGVDEQAAEIMTLARGGDRTIVELTAHESTGGGHHHTDVSVNVISTDIGLILVSPPAGEPRKGGRSVFAPGDAFAVAMAVRDLTARLPSGTWFPNENYSI